MKTATKILSLLLAVVMLLGVTACGSNQNTDVSSSEPSSVDQSSTEEVSSEEPSSEAESSSEETSSKTPNGVAIGKDDNKGGVWDGTVASGISKGNGTKDHPYIIYSAQEFAYAMTSAARRDYYFELANDIYLNDVKSKDWMLNKKNNAWFTDVSFSGNLDGKGHCIYGLWIDPTPDKIPESAGLFAWFEKGSVSNLGIRYSFIIGEKFAGAFVGRVNQAGNVRSFKNCFVDETVYVQYKAAGGIAAGGIIGYAYAGGKTEPQITIENCYSKAQLKGSNPDRTNGIVGSSYDCAYSINGCYSVGYDPYYGVYNRYVSQMVAEGISAKEVYKNVYTTQDSPSGKEHWTKVELSKIKGSAAATTMSGLDFKNAYQTVNGGTPKLKVFSSIDGKDVSVTPIDQISLASFDPPPGKPLKQ